MFHSSRYYLAVLMICSICVVPTVVSSQTVIERNISGVAGLKISPGAAQAGTAEAFGVVTSDVYSLYYNPAGSIHAGKYAVGLMHNKWFTDVRSEYLGFIWSPDKVAIGASLQYNSVGDIERRETATTEPISLFDAQDIVAGLTAGFFISPELSLGMTAKIIYEKIDVSSGTAYAVDFGGYYEFLPQVHVGIAVANLGSTIKLENQEDDLPTIVRAGGSYSYRTLSVGMSLITPADDKAHFHIGAENTISETLVLRAGYATGYDVKDVAFGFGIIHRFVSIDYAYTPIKSDLGDSHRFSLTFSWR